MTRIMFVPFSALAGLLAGRVHKRAFTWLWGLVDDEQAPDSSLADGALVQGGRGAGPRRRGRRRHRGALRPRLTRDLSLADGPLARQGEAAPDA